MRLQIRRLPFGTLHRQNHIFILSRRRKPDLRQRPAIAVRNSHTTYSMASTSTSTSTSTKSANSRPFEYHHIEGVELIEAYHQPGGYRLVNIGDELHEYRYRVLHKIGHGSYATSWLARDTFSRKLVAVKVGRAESSPREVEVLSALTAQKHNPMPIELLGRAIIPLVLDSFTILGSSGSHPCYVTTLGTEDLLSITDNTRTGMHNLDVSRALAAQLVLAVAYIHSQGFVHGGKFESIRLASLKQNLPNQTFCRSSPWQCASATPI